MDRRTEFYFSCLKSKVGLLMDKHAESNMKNFRKVTASRKYKETLASGNAYLCPGIIPGSWVAVYNDIIDEDIAEEVELSFNHKPNVDEILLVRFILQLEDYILDAEPELHVDYQGNRIHWTLLPIDDPEEKWNTYIQLRDKQEEA